MAEGIAFALDDALSRVVDDGPHEHVLAGEVVVQLRLAHSSRRHHVVERGGPDSPEVHQVGRCGDDPCPRLCTARRHAPAVGRVSGRHHESMLLIGLLVPGLARPPSSGDKGYEREAERSVERPRVLCNLTQDASSMNRCLSQRLNVGRLWSHQLLDQGAAPNGQRRCVDDGQISSFTVNTSAKYALILHPSRSTPST